MPNKPHTTSLSFPNIFDVSRNRVGVLADNASIVNRCRLLLLTDQTSMYNLPQFGGGLKQYLFTYNGQTTRALIEDRIRDQLRMYEPFVDVDRTQFNDTLISDDGAVQSIQYDDFYMTVGLATTYSDTADLNISKGDL